MFMIEVTKENGKPIIQVNNTKFSPGAIMEVEGNQICVTFDENNLPVLEVFRETKQMFLNCPGAEVFTPVPGLKMVYDLHYWVNVWKQLI